MSFPALPKIFCRSSLPPPPPTNWSASEVASTSPPPPSRPCVSSSATTDASTVFSAPSNFVVICHGLIQLPSPVPEDNKLRMKLMKTCAKSLQAADGRFLLFSIQEDRVCLYGKADPSTILYRLPFKQMDLFKLSRKDRTFFYLTVNTPVAEFSNEKDVSGTSGPELEQASCGNESTISVCYVFHALNHMSASRLYARLKLFIERYEREHAVLSPPLPPPPPPSPANASKPSSRTALLGEQEAEVDFWQDFQVLNDHAPLASSSFTAMPSTSQTLLSSVFDSSCNVSESQSSPDGSSSTTTSDSSLKFDPFGLFAPPTTLPSISGVSVPPRQSLSSPSQVARPLNPFMVTNPFGRSSLSGFNSLPASSFSYCNPTVRALVPMASGSLKNSEKDGNVMPCATHTAKEKNGQQFFDDQFNDFLSETVKNHFTTGGPSSNSNLLN